MLFTFIACQGGPAGHFADYAKKLQERGHEVQVCAASGPSSQKLSQLGQDIHFAFSLEGLSAAEKSALAEDIAKTCRVAHAVITDCGDSFGVDIQEALKKHASASRRFTYYDNLEPFVPGGYSSNVADIIAVSEKIIFSNKNLALAKIYRTNKEEIDFTGKERFGVGYYPVEQAKKIAEQRKNSRDSVRSSFLAKHEMHENGQKIGVYFGGNNEEYFSRALPAFLSFIAEASSQTDLSNTVVVLQQHPGAKAKNLDIQQVEAWLATIKELSRTPRFIFSDFSSDEALVLADTAFYYQTTMAPLFVLAKIPTAQIGHEVYGDIVVRNNLVPAITSSEAFIQLMAAPESMNQMDEQKLLNSLGIDEDWLLNLETILLGEGSSAVLPNAQLT